MTFIRRNLHTKQNLKFAICLKSYHSDFIEMQVKMAAAAKRGQYCKYDPALLEEIIHKIETKELTFYMASKTSGIPRSTLQDKVKQRHTQPIGRPRAFTAEEETKMKVYADSMNNIGRGLWVSDLQKEGEKITARNPRRGNTHSRMGSPVSH